MVWRWCCHWRTFFVSCSELMLRLKSKMLGYFTCSTGVETEKLKGPIRGPWAPAVKKHPILQGPVGSHGSLLRKIIDFKGVLTEWSLLWTNVISRPLGPPSYRPLAGCGSCGLRGHRHTWVYTGELKYDITCHHPYNLPIIRSSAVLMLLKM